MADHQQMMVFWDAALEAEVGISIETSSQSSAKQALYQARKASQSLKYKNLTILTPQTSEVWIVKTEIYNAAKKYNTIGP